MSQDPLLLVVLGPTASGKSALALALAERYGGEIVNCDSVQLYRGMDIGAAKTPVEDRRGIPHHLIDILDPSEHFTAGDYSRVARPLLREIAGTGRVPVVVGGTGFYLRALLEGLSVAPPRDEQLRARLLTKRSEVLHRLLQRFDPDTASKVHAHDRNKVVRALEICIRARRQRGQLFLENRAEPLHGFRVIKIGLNPERGELARKIDARCEQMFADGLIEETAGLLAKGVPMDAKALLSIGYRESIAVLQREITREEALRRTQAATRQYAKRQRTWFRKESHVFWHLGFGSDESALRAIVHHLEVGINFL